MNTHKKLNKLNDKLMHVLPVLTLKIVNVTLLQSTISCQLL